MKEQSGMSLVEVLVVVAIMGIGLSIGALYVNPLANPVKSGTALLEGFFREARMSAIAGTSAYRISPGGPADLRAEFAGSCSATSWTTDPRMTLDLPHGLVVSPDTWEVCFSSRGISTNNVVIKLYHPEFGSAVVEVLVGGTTRVLE